MESKDWNGFGYFSPDLEKIKQLLACSKHENTWEDTGNVIKVFFSIQSKKRNVGAVKGNWVFNAICRKKSQCHQLVIEITKIYLEGINFLLSRNSWILKLRNDVRWIMETGVWVHRQTMPAGLMSRSSADGIWQFWNFLADAKIETKIRHDTICLLIWSREFWFCLVVQIAQIGTNESIFS